MQWSLPWGPQWRWSSAREGPPIDAGAPLGEGEVCVAAELEAGAARVGEERLELRGHRRRAPLDKCVCRELMVEAVRRRGGLARQYEEERLEPAASRGLVGGGECAARVQRHRHGGRARQQHQAVERAAVAHVCKRRRVRWRLGEGYDGRGPRSPAVPQSRGDGE